MFNSGRKKVWGLGRRHDPKFDGVLGSPLNVWVNLQVNPNSKVFFPES